MMTKEEIVEKFTAYNFHNDTIHAIKIFPSSNEEQAGGKVSYNIAIDFTDYQTDRREVLILKDCANVSFRADFDVLLAESPRNMGGIEIDASPIEVEAFVKNQRSVWNVEYAASMQNPIEPKLQSIDSYVLFRIVLYGGILEIVAKGYELKNLSK